MTNEELIATIRNEIERRITDNTFGAKLELIDILAWLDTLESEKPINPEAAMKELDEKIALVKQRGTWDGVDVDKYMDKVRGREPEKPMNLEDGLVEEVKRYYSDNFEYISSDQPTLSILTNIARYFYDLGCRRTAEKFDEIEYNRQRAEESVPKDLEEAAHLFSQSPEPLYSPGHRFHWDDDALFGKQIETTFIAGAKWQAKQFLKGSPMPEDTVLFNKGVEEGRRLERDEFENNRLAACNNQTKEEYNRETDFALEIIKKEHRQPTFSDAINYGMQLQKGQMMNNAIECLVCAGMEGDKWIMTYIGSYESMLETCKVGDKVRIIIVKED